MTQSKFEHFCISDTKYEAPDNRPRTKTMAECDVNLGSFYIMSPAGRGEIAPKYTRGRAVTSGHDYASRNARAFCQLLRAREICLLRANVILCARVVHKYVK